MIHFSAIIFIVVLNFVEPVDILMEGERIQTQALVDTGATICSIHESLVSDTVLRASEKTTRVTLANGKKIRRPVVYLNIELRGRTLSGVRFYVKNGGTREVSIGRNVIKLGYVVAVR